MGNFKHLPCYKGWCVILCLLIPMTVMADNFSIVQANTRLTNHLYTLSAKIQYPLSDESIKALHNGIALTLVLSINVQRKRWYWWNESIADIQQRYQIKYQLLTETYQLMYLNTEITRDFNSLSLLLETLGNIKNLPLLDEKFIENDEKYRVNLYAKLDIESLPPSLRPLAYISSDWRLNSGDYQCLLEK